MFQQSPPNLLASVYYYQKRREMSGYSATAQLMDAVVQLEKRIAALETRVATLSTVVLSDPIEEH
jgi:hypothetical protein